VSPMSQCDPLKEAGTFKMDLKRIPEYGPQIIIAEVLMKIFPIIFILSFSINSFGDRSPSFPVWDCSSIIQEKGKPKTRRSLFSIKLSEWGHGWEGGHSLGKIGDKQIGIYILRPTNSKHWQRYLLYISVEPKNGGWSMVSRTALSKKRNGFVNRIKRRIIGAH